MIRMNELSLFLSSFFLCFFLYGSIALWTLAFFSFLILYRVGRTPWTGDQPLVRKLPTHRTTQTQNKRTQTSMHRVGFEPKTSVFERAKTVHALDRAATVIGSAINSGLINSSDEVFMSRIVYIHNPSTSKLKGNIFWRVTPCSQTFRMTVTSRSSGSNN
jgi:hypothetical protein